MVLLFRFFYVCLILHCSIQLLFDRLTTITFSHVYRHTASKGTNFRNYFVVNNYKSVAKIAITREMKITSQYFKFSLFFVFTLLARMVVAFIQLFWTTDACRKVNLMAKRQKGPIICSCFISTHTYLTIEPMIGSRHHL